MIRESYGQFRYLRPGNDSTTPGLDVVRCDVRFFVIRAEVDTLLVECVPHGFGMTRHAHVTFQHVHCDLLLPFVLDQQSLVCLDHAFVRLVVDGSGATNRLLGFHRVLPENVEREGAGRTAGDLADTSQPIPILCVTAYKSSGEATVLKDRNRKLLVTTWVDLPRIQLTKVRLNLWWAHE